MEEVYHEPDAVNFRSYTDYLSQTPESFSPSSGPPILFRRFYDAKLRILQSDLVHAPLLASFVTSAANGQESVAVHEPTQNEEVDPGVVLEASGVQIWAASEYADLTLIPFCRCIRSSPFLRFFTHRSG